MNADPEAPGAPRLAREFADCLGRRPTGVWAAPGRVNLIGEHTDYNDGFALPLALPLRVTVAASAREDGVLVIRSLQRGGVTVRGDELSPGSLTGWAGYVAGVWWALRRAGYGPGGAEMLVDSDLPAGSGLSSSAALECAVAVALDDLWSLGASRDELGRIAQRAENDFVGMPCGIMDQMASLRCTAGHALFLDCRDLSTRQVPLDLSAAGLRLLVVDTRAPHRHVGGEYASRRRGCEQAAAALDVPALRDLSGDMAAEALPSLDEESRRYVRHVVSENARVLGTVERLDAGDIGGVGPLLTRSHESLRDDYRVSCPELDTAVEAALDAGALGARMTGGGFGGCAIALVDRSKTEDVAAAVSESFRARGFRQPASFTALASEGASRVQ